MKSPPAELTRWARERQANNDFWAVGPAGLAYDPHTDVLYVASTGDNAIPGQSLNLDWETPGQNRCRKRRSEYVGG